MKKKILTICWMLTLFWQPATAFAVTMDSYGNELYKGDTAENTTDSGSSSESATYETEITTSSESGTESSLPTVESTENSESTEESTSSVEETETNESESEETADSLEKAVVTETLGVKYATQLDGQNTWQADEMDGSTAGIPDGNPSVGLKAIKIQLENLGDEDGSIEYKTHNKKTGWGPEDIYAKDGKSSGSSIIEAIRIRLTGDIAKKYHVYYRVRTEKLGWLGWAKDDGKSGTEGFSESVRAIQICVMPIGKSPGISPTDRVPFIKYQSLDVSYKTHIQSSGWEKEDKKNGVSSGTVNQAKRLEAIRIKVGNLPTGLTGDIQYETHVQSIGWQGIKINDQIAGTEGEAKRLEAIRIRLTGDLEKFYDVYYTVHSQTFGWLDWAGNGQNAGTEGFAYRLESIKIQIVKKGQPAPGSTKTPYTKFKIPTLRYRTHVQTYGWQEYKNNPLVAGTTNEAKRLEAIQISLSNLPDKVSGGVQYKTHVQSIGWQGFVANGASAGTSGLAKRLEAIQINLTGDAAKYYDVYYRTHSQTFGWLGWAKNGQSSGTEGYAYRSEAIQIQLVKKGNAAPGSTANAFRKKPPTPAGPTVSGYLGTTRAKLLNELNLHRIDRFYLGTPYRGLGSDTTPARCMSPLGAPNRYGAGMNCTGFVALAMQRAGGNLAKITTLASAYGTVTNAYNWRDALKKKAQYYTYNSVNDLLKGGKAQKGDIIYFEPNYALPNYDCHIGFFWGDKPSDNKIWHQVATGNQISHIFSGTPYTKVFLFKM